MRGYQITFFTQQDRLHGRIPLAQWLIEQAKRLGMRGATLNGGLGGLGHDGVMHTINLFDLSDQPVQVTLIVTEEEAGHFFRYLQKEKVNVFYVKVAVEFGMLPDTD